ncbi:NADH-quinone oxidoreductase subunit NuoN [Sodalis sp. CWE]|uniref:NADH-quinone oxidoreductase subunit NuoN n=1 Tax=Sodalis sp. CWE TaxID=2803816 RepID=UPI001C7D3927|nr:NADH-quinone oxidoreductase subunit NuoN [Sodalis sp. CWE]
MNLLHQQLIALLPLLIIGSTVMVAVLCTAWKRNHFISFILTIFGQILALASLWFIVQNNPPSIDVTSLIRVDKYSLFYTGLILIASLIISMQVYAWLDEYSGNRDEFYLLMLISLMGCILLINTKHLITFFIGIELTSLPFFGMIGYIIQQRSSLEASIKYMLLSSVSSAFLLFGIALVYVQTGQLSFSSFCEKIYDNSTTYLTQPVLLVGLGLMIVSIGFKLSLVPFHLWTPDVYQGAPVLVSALLSTSSKIAIFTIVTRLFLSTVIMNSHSIQLTLIVIACASMLFGNLMAINQDNIKRIMGYSSVSHFGYLLVGLITMQTNHIFSLEAIGICLIGYLFASLGIFTIINLKSNFYQNEKDSLYSYRGLFWHHPFLTFVLTIMFSSLAGIPMTLGFIGKCYILALGEKVKDHFFLLTSIIIISNTIGLFYYMRIIINMFLPLSKKTRYDNVSSSETLSDGLTKIVVVFSSSLLLLFGLYPTTLISLVRSVTLDS